MFTIEWPNGSETRCFPYATARAHAADAADALALTFRCIDAGELEWAARGGFTEAEVHSNAARSREG